MIRYIQTYCFTGKELFKNFDPGKVHLKKLYVQSHYGHHSKMAFFGMVLSYFMTLVINDVIEENAEVYFPLLNNRNSFISAQEITGDDLKIALQRGAMKRLDYIATNFVGYKIMYSWETKHGYRKKEVYVNGKYRDRFTELINSGKKYG